MFTKRYLAIRTIGLGAMLVLALGLAACQPLLVAAPAAVESPVRSTQEVWNHHTTAVQTMNLSMLMEDYADDAIMVLMAGPAVGKEAVEATFEGLFAAAPGLKFTVWEPVIHDNVVLLHWAAESDVGTFPNGAATFIIEDGKIQRQAEWFEFVPRQ